jgi:membrane protein implicated in regulation of membrane protease activity
MLMVVTIIAVGCLPALAAAFSLPSEIVAWCCVAISAVGLVMLIVEGRFQRRKSVAESEDQASGDVGSAAILDADAPTIEAPTETFAVSRHRSDDDRR